MKTRRKLVVFCFCAGGFAFLLITLLSNGSILGVRKLTSWTRSGNGLSCYRQLQSINGTAAVKENKLQDCFTEKPERTVSVMDIFRSIHTNWSFNAEEASKVRSELEESCQTSNLFITTQENVKYHGTIRYEGERFWWAFVTSDVYNRLPKKVPYKKGKFKKCSVVGNGGILLGSKCGKFIDAADFVIRMNFANVKNYTGDVGFKTDLVTCNPSQLIKQFSNLNKGGAEKLKNYAMQQYKSARVYTTPFAYQVLRNYCFKAQDILKPANIEVVFAHSDHLSSQRRFYGTKKNIKENRVTTGLLMFTAAISFCEEVHLYGFWPFSEDPDGKTLHYHYYEEQMHAQPVHDMTAEFKMLVDLHNKGAIRLHVGMC